MMLPPPGTLARVHPMGFAAIEESLHRCELDGLALAQHPRCRECGVLIGPAHVEKVSFGGRCSVCARDPAQEE